MIRLVAVGVLAVLLGGCEPVCAPYSEVIQVPQGKDLVKSVTVEAGKDRILRVTWDVNIPAESNVWVQLTKWPYEDEKGNTPLDRQLGQATTKAGDVKITAGKVSASFGSPHLKSGGKLAAHLTMYDNGAWKQPEPTKDWLRKALKAGVAEKEDSHGVTHVSLQIAAPFSLPACK